MSSGDKIKIKHVLEFAPIWFVLALGRLLPYALRGKMFAGLGGFLARKLPKARDRVHSGLNRVFPDLSDEDRDRITKDVGANTARTLSEILMNDDFKKRANLFTASGAGLDVLRTAKSEGRGAIIVSAHFGQWEAIRHYLASQNMETGAVYRQNNNPLYERRFLKSILQGGLPIVPRGNSGNMTMIRHLKKGGFFALLVDQKYSLGQNISFMGHDAMTTTAPAEMALRYGLPLVPVFATRADDGQNIEIDFETEIQPSDAVEMTKEINARIAQRISDKPSQWYWLHNRWTN